MLESCYVSAFDLALENQIRSIAFPCISTGIYGYPRREAAEIAISTMRKYENRFEKIVGCCFGTEEKKIYEQILQDRLN